MLRLRGEFLQTGFYSWLMVGKEQQSFGGGSDIELSLRSKLSRANISNSGEKHLEHLELFGKRIHFKSKHVFSSKYFFFWGLYHHVFIYIKMAPNRFKREKSPKFEPDPTTSEQTQPARLHQRPTLRSMNPLASALRVVSDRSDLLDFRPFQNP